jgi:hypothetical protein
VSIADAISDSGSGLGVALGVGGCVGCSAVGDGSRVIVGRGVAVGRGVVVDFSLGVPAICRASDSGCDVAAACGLPVVTTLIVAHKHSIRISEPQPTPTLPAIPLRQVRVMSFTVAWM